MRLNSGGPVCAAPWSSTLTGLRASCRAALATALLITQPALAASVLVLATDRDGKPLADAVITVHVPGAPIRVPGRPATLVQEGFTFQPYVLPIVVGSQVTFPNKDRVAHHLRSSSKEYDFEFPIYEPGRTTVPLRFDKIGTVQLNCLIHNSMRAYVRVVDTPFFALTDDHGAARIEGVPAGSFEVRGWHPDLIVDGPVSTVQFGAQPVNLPLRFALSPQQKPKLRAATPAATPGSTGSTGSSGSTY